MPPKTEMITSVSVIEETVNVRFLNSRRSISASVVRSAWRTKNASAIAPASMGRSTFAEPKPPSDPDCASP